MVDVASAFGIAFLVVTVAMAVALTWLGFNDPGPTAADDVEEPAER